jgi:F0F1-type ATP synthase delta subunit
MTKFSNTILENCFTKTAALVALSDLGEQVRSRKVSVEDYQKTKKEIEGIEPLHLELAIELDEKQLKQLVTKLRGDYAPNFLVETTVNPDLIGGARISYKGKLEDYSVRKNIK